MKPRLVAGVLALLAAGCAGVPSREIPPEARAAWEARQAAFASIGAWELRGRMSLRTPDQSLHASIHWVRRGERHEIDLAGPLGGGHMRLSHDTGGARLRTAAGRTYEAPDAEELLYRATGWRLPLAGLNYWVLGLPAPATPANEDIDEHGRLRALQQLGWKVDFLAYNEYQGLDLPSKLYLTRRLPDAGDSTDVDPRLELRVVISHWELPK